MSTIKLYIPIIRWRPAEIRAIKNLYPKDRSNITPLFEFILPPPTTDKKDYKKILEDSRSKFLRHLPDITHGIVKHWGGEPAFVDVHLLDGGIRAYAFEQILSSANKIGIFSIPITYIVPALSTEADMASREVAVKFAKISNRGLCIRIDESHLNSNLPLEIENFVNSNMLDISTIDVLVDLKIVDETINARLVIDKLSNIPHIEKWRSFILTGGSFPKDLSGFEKHGHYTIERFDWRLWKKLIEDKTLKRRPLFSDYTIQHPIYYGHIVGANTSASIRYTNNETWEVLRGEGLRNEKGAGYQQYPAQAKLLVGQTFYKGANYSFGDTYIWGKAQAINTTPGSPQTWLTAGINHHMTLAVDQIATLP